VRSQAEAVVECVRLLLEVVEAEQHSVVVARREVAFGGVPRLAVVVVEIVRRLVAPLRQLAELRRLHRLGPPRIAPYPPPPRAARPGPPRAAPPRAPGGGRPRMNPAASASPAPVESTASTGTAACSPPSTVIPRTPRLTIRAPEPTSPITAHSRSLPNTRSG